MAEAAIFRGGGEMGALMRRVDWSATALGAAESWPQSLRTAVSILLDSKFPMYIAWGAEFVQLYNDGYRPVLGATKHPSAMGGRAADTFVESWQIIGPMFHGVRAGEAFGSEDWMLPLDRNGYLEECYFTFSYSPIRDESGGVGGVLVTVTETTARVVAARQLRALHDLAARAASVTSSADAFAGSAAVLDRYRADVPFALFYEAGEGGRPARLVGATGSDVAAASRPEAWPLDEAIASGRTLDVSDVRRRAGDIAAGDGPDLVTHALALPIRRPGDDARPYGVLVAGSSPRRRLDDEYRSFFALVAGHVSTALTNAEALAHERRRSEQLAELDRAKTEFFSNISHEFRTPLTLLLAPVEDALADREVPLPPVHRERHELVHRNALRLQKLVTSLLDFSRVEAGRARASFEMVDLPTLTIDLASSFRSVVEAAGIDLVVACPALPRLVAVDRVMWEKIVLNLLSNAFKFTLEGTIRISLAAANDRIELSVEDTGIGIPEHEQPRIFERFHRVEGARGRSHEGTGIGLSLVRELVLLHGGTLRLESAPGRGSTFVVSMPMRATAEESRDSGVSSPPGVLGPPSFLAEVAQWDDATSAPAAMSAPSSSSSRAEGHAAARVVVVDDNADMRAYLSRLLSPHWHVETFGDGQDALPRVLASPPDLILADVMMPRMSGLELVRRLRRDERTRTLPIILLSARAGEDSTIAGLDSGADDYLVKPFAASELRARVRSQLALARARREAADAARRHVDETERLLEDARRAVRSREETLAVVSHDLRSPLGAISIATDLLERLLVGDEPSPRTTRTIASIRRATGRMDRLISDLLDVASIEAGTLSIQPEPQQVEDLLREARETFEAQAAEKGVTLAVEGDDSGATTIACDRGRILQVLGNLLSNALKFTPPGGTVTLRSERTTSGARFSVSDTGIGIPAEAVPHVFDRYWHSTQEGREGHGLGLTITRGIVLAHGGVVRAESAPGRGSVFSVFLPRDPYAAEAPTRAAPPDAAEEAPAVPARTPVTAQWLTGGEMASVIAALDWSRSPLGPIDGWPQSLRTTVSLCLASNFPINIIWGEDHVQIYNDGYRVVCGAVHPRAMGEDYRVTWASAWPAIGEPFERALAGETSYLENQRMFLERNGYVEETFFTFSLSPIRDDSGKIAGLFHPVTETTATMLADRRTRLLRDIGDGAGSAPSFDDACELLLAALERDDLDVPFAALYVTSEDGTAATLRGLRGAPPGSPLAPPEVSLRGGDVASSSWPLIEAAGSARPLPVRDVIARFGPTPAGPYPEPLASAVVLPARVAGVAGPPPAFLVVGASQRLPLDDAYQGFLEMLGTASSAALGNARAYEMERKRAESLAELDRAKTAFFSNVSHEFRTPLTLMLGPLRDLLAGAHGEVSPTVRHELAVIQRSAARLLKLVNALLDFSRIEAGRAQVNLEPTDLGALTRDVASAFRSAIESAGLRFEVSIDALPDAIPVDREMWEKIVLNLLSNAYKFTLEGEVALSLRVVGASLELVVRDTGIGIAPEDVGRVFDRFHRVQGATGRSHEGSGIGLALVKDLAHLHGGSAGVESAPGRGASFFVRIPLTSQAVGRRIAPRPARASAARLEAFVGEAAHWNEPKGRGGDEARATGETTREARSPDASATTNAARGRIVLADDNADMRDYVRRLLEAAGYAVTAVADGAEALRAAEELHPDLVLSDVMMPVMDGAALVGRLRANAALRAVPIILLSARAGEDETAGALELGADDYLTKPFSAKELMARIGSQLAMASLRRRTAEQDARASERLAIEAELRQGIELRDQFILIASHELRTPLTSLQLQVSALLRQFKRNAEASVTTERLALIDRQVDRMARLVSDLLEVNQVSAGRVKISVAELDLTEIAASLPDRLRAELDAAGCSLALECEPSVRARGDRLRVEQIVSNFVANALRYGAGKPVQLSVRSSGASAVVAVRDHGIGIAAEDHARIFERFGRAASSENYGGFGLGLWIVKIFADAMGGTVRVNSELGEGSTFMLELPLVRTLDGSSF